MGCCARGENIPRKPVTTVPVERATNVDVFMIDVSVRGTARGNIGEIEDVLMGWMDGWMLLSRCLK